LRWSVVCYGDARRLGNSAAGRLGNSVARRDALSACVRNTNGEAETKTGGVERAGDRAANVPGILAGRPTVGSVIALMAIVLVIGVSGGYLAFRFAGPSTPAADQRAGSDDALAGPVAPEPAGRGSAAGPGHIQLDQQRLDEAESIYRQVLSLQPKNVEAITHVGTVLLRRGQAIAALREYDAALAIEPDYVHALWDKATLLQQSWRITRGHPDLGGLCPRGGPDSRTQRPRSGSSARRGRPCRTRRRWTRRSARSPRQGRRESVV